MRNLLSILPKPSRYIGSEEGSVHKDPSSCSMHIGLAFPDLYEVGMSYLGQKILYSIINEHKTWWAERVFSPCKDAGDILKKHSTLLCTLESGTPLKDLDALAFSITHELCYTNVLYMLDLAGIPFTSAERNKHNLKYPLILTGGGCCLAAEPIAPFIDAMMLGEGEEVLPKVVSCIELSKKNNASRLDILKELSFIPGVYVPEFFEVNSKFINQNKKNNLNLHSINNNQDTILDKLSNDKVDYKAYNNCSEDNLKNYSEISNYETKSDYIDSLENFYKIYNISESQDTVEETSDSKDSYNNKYLKPIFEHHTEIKRQVIPDLDLAAYPDKQPIPFGAVHNRLALEIARGCTRGCRFCQAGTIYRPVRERKIDNLENILTNCLNNTGFDDVSYLSLSTGDFSALKKLFLNNADKCKQEQISISLPSLRVGSVDDEIIEKIAGIRRTGATLAPEAGSQRLRDVINKGITEEEIILHVQKLFEHGWQQVKLYFMIGLPTETDEDLKAIIELCKKVRDAAGAGVKRLQITASVSPFVPKPHTPFQWERQISLTEVKRRIGVLLNEVKKEKRIKLRWHVPEMSVLEGVFSRGDRSLAPVILSAYNKGAIFTCWLDHFKLEHWLDALNENNLNMDYFHRERDFDEALPWDHLNSGISKEFLLRERNKGISEKITLDCRYNNCNVCGVCDLSSKPSLLHEKDASDGIEYKNTLNFSKRDQKPHEVKLDEHNRVIVRNSNSGQPLGVSEHLVNKKIQLRFRYSKKGTGIFLSQLELQDIFTRVMRRAKLPLSFSQGFHPLPLISFGRALPVGVASENEWFSVYLYDNVNLDEVLKQLNSTLPKDIDIIDIEELGLQKENADSLADVYSVNIKDIKLKDSFKLALSKIMSLDSIPFTKESKKGLKEYDAKSFIKDINIINDDAKITLSWEEQYLSPVLLILSALEHVGLNLNIYDINFTKLKTA